MRIFQKRYISLYDAGKSLAWSLHKQKGNQSETLSSHLFEFSTDLALSDKLKDLPLEKASGVVWTVRSGDYQLFQIKKPLVDKKEMENALSWTVQDKIFFKEDDYILSHFPCEKVKPVEEIFVVVFRKSHLLEGIDLLKKHFGCVLAVKIPELSAISLLDYQDPHHDKFVIYCDNIFEKDIIYGVKNQALIKTTVSPTPFDVATSEAGILPVVETIQALLHQYAHHSNFEIHVSPTLKKANQWVQIFDKVFPNKALLGVHRTGDEKTPSLPKQQLLAIGGGLAYAKDCL